MGYRKAIFMLEIFSICMMRAPAYADAPTRDPAAVAAYEYLKTLPRHWAGLGQLVHSEYDCHTYEDKNIDGLVPLFAKRAAAFLKAFQEMYKNAVETVAITSAYRSEEEQACVCAGEWGPCAGRIRARVLENHHWSWLFRMLPGRYSEHEKGLALDVRAGTGLDVEFRCMQDFARSNPQLGVYFPLGMTDRPHMQPNWIGDGEFRPDAPPRRVASCEKIDLKDFGGMY